MKVVKEYRLIMARSGSNNNKFWYGRLFDNGDVETEWGRVGHAGTKTPFPGKGEAFLDRKKAQKEKKGYVHLKTVAAQESSSKVDGNLQDIARKELTGGDKDLEALIDGLVRQNIHRITSNTQITYSDQTGLFQTPLGIVTQEAIDEARNLLVKIINNKDLKTQSRKKANFEHYVDEYLRLVPHDVGMKFDPYQLFPNVDAVKQENDILDSLEASLAQFNTRPKSDGSKQTGSVFGVSLCKVDDKEFKRVRDKYHKTRKDTYVCSHLDVKGVYEISIKSMVDAFRGNMQNVKELWHGTRSANVLSILKSGLKMSPPSSTQINGKMFGNGIYFALDSTKSLNYSYGYWSSGSYDNHCFMFLADVAMGDYYIPSSWNESFPPKNHDSVWAKSGVSGLRNDELIVYKEDQCNLIRLVEFKG